MKLACLAALMMGLTATTALAQVPTSGTDWATTTLTQHECLAHAEAVMRRFGMRRIERLGQSVYADSASNLDQVIIRCIADRQIVFFAAAGRHANQQVILNLLRTLRDAFNRSY